MNEHTKRPDIVERLNAAYIREAIAEIAQLKAEIERLRSPAPAVCGACGQPWTGEKCGQADNSHPFPVCYPFVSLAPAAPWQLPIWIICQNERPFDYRFSRAAAFERAKELRKSTPSGNWSVEEREGYLSLRSSPVPAEDGEGLREAARKLLLLIGQPEEQPSERTAFDNAVIELRAALSSERDERKP